MNKKKIRIGFLITNDHQMKKVNQKLFNDATPTDVISIPIDDDLSSDQQILGEIVVNSDEVTRNATKHHHSYPVELARVVTHGVLHLLGYTDDTPDRRSAMQAIEDTIVKEMNPNEEVTE